MIAALVVALETEGARHVEREVWSLTALRLARSPEAVLAELPDGDRAAATLAFARAGIGVADTARAIAPGRALVAAIASTLEPLDRGTVAYDVVWIRPVSVAEATRRLRRSGGPLRRRRDADLARCRAVLREADRVLAWRRVLWAEPAVLRRGLRDARPVVFDRDAVHASSERWTFASDERLTRWLAA